MYSLQMAKRTSTCTPQVSLDRAEHSEVLKAMTDVGAPKNASLQVPSRVDEHLQPGSPHSEVFELSGDEVEVRIVSVTTATAIEPLPAGTLEETDV